MTDEERRAYLRREIDRLLDESSDRKLWLTLSFCVQRNKRIGKERGTGLISCPFFFDSTFFTKTSPRICAL